MREPERKEKGFVNHGVVEERRRFPHVSFRFIQ